jgi:hypothetical protein
MKNHWLEQRKKKDCGCRTKTASEINIDRMISHIRNRKPIRLGAPKGII